MDPLPKIFLPPSTFAGEPNICPRKSKVIFNAKCSRALSLTMLENQVAIVTGSSRGIGRAIALEFSRAGAKVVINYFRSEKEALALKNQIESEGRVAKVVMADVTKEEDAKRLVDETIGEFGKLDILVNNAGTTHGRSWGPFGKTSPEDWEVVLDNNLKSVLQCTRNALPHMIQSGRGKIINVVSESGVRGNRHNPVYAAAKGGVVLFTRSLALQVVKHGITVNCIAPGAVLTGASELHVEGKPSVADYIREIPMGRMATPEEVAKIVAFMASENMSYMTGQCIVVDGGWTL
jgi:3-oxoacyl-[acyl-carrier protein] reductase